MPAPGTLLAGRYRLVEPSGSDAWKARDEVLGRVVTVRVGEESRAARLTHPNVVSIYDAGEDAGTRFVVTEHFDAQTLEDRAAGGHLTASVVAKVGAQAAAALARAHAEGLVHGHVGSRSVLVGAGDTVKLAGFRPGEDLGDDTLALVRALDGLLGHDADSERVRRSVRAAAPRGAAELARILSGLVEPDDAEPLVVRDATPPAGTRIPPRRARRRWVVLVAPIAVLTGASAVAIAVLRGGGDAGPSGGVDVSAPVPITAVRVFDPEGRGGEHDDEARRVVDGNASTAWRTHRYRGKGFAGLKSGVGLILELARETRLGALTVDTQTLGWSARVYVAPAAEASLAGWGPPVAGKEAVDGATTFALDGRTGRAVLLWLTDPGVDHQALVAECVVRSADRR